MDQGSVEGCFGNSMQLTEALIVKRSFTRPVSCCCDCGLIRIDLE